MRKTNSRKSERPTPEEICFGDRAMGGGEQDLLSQVPRPRRCSEGWDKQYSRHAETAEKVETSEASGNVLDVDNIAALFRCSREKIKRMARSGELPAFKFGKSWYVLQEDLERFLSSRVQSSRHLRRIQEVSP